MKKLKYILPAAAIALLLSSCSVTIPYAVTENPIGSKKGTSKTFVLFGIQLNGNYGLEEATKKIKGGVSTIDIKTTNFFVFLPPANRPALPPFIGTQEIIVTGE